MGIITSDKVLKIFEIVELMKAEIEKQDNGYYTKLVFLQTDSVWIAELIMLAKNRGIREHDLREIERIIYDNLELLKKEYYEYHGRE